MRRIGLIGWGIWLLTATGSAADRVSLLRSAIEQWADEVDRWSFVQHVREYRGDQLRETRVEHFDPSQPDKSRWRLLEINGRAPTRREQREFDARKNAKPRVRLDEPAKYTDFEHVTIALETADSVLFDVPLRKDVSLFVPFEDLSAQVEVDKKSATIRQATIGLRREMRIAFGLARVSKLELAFDLQEALAQEPVENSQTDENAGPNNRASATITKLGRRVEITWSDFVRLDETK
jgi:hypothetical protein